MSRRARFLNLERSRAEQEAASPAQESGRFASLEQEPSTAPCAQLELGVAERFRVPDASTSASLELMERSDDDQPFIRCARCEADNGVHAQECFHCGASFASAEQRVFNERLWSQRREERARELAELARFEEQRQTALAADRRRLGEELAVQVAAQTRRRLEIEAPEVWLGRGRLGEALQRLLGRLPRGLRKVGFAGLGLALLVLLVVPKTRGFLVAAGLAIVVIWLRFNLGSRNGWRR